MVREAIRSDLNEILQLYLHLHESTIPDNLPELSQIWEQILDDPNHHLLVSIQDGKIVASCVCVVIPNLTRNAHPYALIENVVTHCDFRRHGYASECLEHAKGIAKNAGCYKIMLLTGAKDAGTLAFYRNSGFNSSDKTAFVQWL